MAALINPWLDGGEAWDRLVLAGVIFTGKITVSGTAWKKKKDRRKARGRNGRRDVGTGWDLGEWSIELVAFDDEHIVQLDALIRALTNRSPSTQDLAALPIEHPQMSVAGISQVLFDEGDALDVDPGGKITWTFKVTGYQPPTPRSVTRSPAPAPQRAEVQPFRPQIYNPRGVQPDFDFTTYQQPTALNYTRTPAAPTADP